MTMTMTPPRIAERYKVTLLKVHGWIKSGELKAVNVATNPNGQPRWRVSEEALAEFEELRSNIRPTTPAPQRTRRTTATAGKQYFN